MIRYSIDNVEQPLISVGDVTTHKLTDITAGVYTSQIATIEDGRQSDWSATVTTIVSETEAAKPSTVTITVQLTGCDNCGLEVK